MIDADYYRDLLRSVFRGRKVIVAVDVLVAAGGTATLLRDLGADPVLALAGTRGTGTAPDNIEYVLLQTDGAPTVVDNIRSFENALQNLPDDARVAIERADPEREAIVLGSFFTPPAAIAGRRVYGGRPPAWNALEDKVVIDSFFDSAGIARAPSVVTAATDFAEGLQKFDRGLGVVVAGDAKEGFNGAAEYLRWIRTDEDREGARAFFEDHCDEVRLMPFLEGIPCSIHGAVIGGRALALRPVEMITLRRPSSRLLYAGCATYWDPPDDDRAYMRDVARRVGAALRDGHGYRGAFTVDGVVTEDGFLPTELNPRAGAGAGPLMAGSGVPYNLLNKAVIEDEDLDLRPEELEELIVTRADEQRAGGAYSSLPGADWPQQTRLVVRGPSGYRLAADGEDADGSITLGPSGVGRFALFAPQPAKIAPGASFAPRAIEAFALIDREFDAGFGPLKAAKPAR